MKRPSMPIVLGAVVFASVGCGAQSAGTEEIRHTSEALINVDTTHVSAGAIVHRTSAGHLEELCSGVLISPTVFLTAGHCTIDSRIANGPSVTFDLTVTDSSPIITGTAHTDPALDLGAYNINNDSHDVGVIVLDTPVTDRPPIALPTADLLTQLHADPRTPITAVGYGIDQNGTNGHNVSYNNDQTRDWGTLEYRALTTNIQADQVKANGVCFGDSGGPDFMTINGHEQLVALNVVVNSYDCNQTAWLYRLDESATRAFLGQYVTLP
jgi:V8-like Glu-specific endopeptidase